MSIYRSYKAGWYSAPGFMPPEGYRTGPLSADRGFSFVNEGTGFSNEGKSKPASFVGYALLQGYSAVGGAFHFTS